MQLGNLKLEDIVEPEYIEQIQNFLDANGFKRTEKCDDIESVQGNYHIFDIPRQFLICGESKMQEFIKFLQVNNLVQKAFKQRIGLTYTPINKLN